MSEKERTKGKWTYNDISGDVEAENDVIIARLFDAKGKGEVETDANGRLLASAPELLEAGDELIKVLDSYARDVRARNGSIMRAFHRFESAVRQAKGGEWAKNYSVSTSK